MRIEQKKKMPGSGWQTMASNLENKEVQLVLAFGDRFALSDENRYQELKQTYPTAHIVMTSTSGNILGTNIDDESIVTVAMAFEKSTRIKIQRINVSEVENCAVAGGVLGKSLEKEGLVHVLLFSDGQLVNGTLLIAGLTSELPPSVFVTGGLAGDYNRFEKAITGVDSAPKEGEIVVIGFYGPHIKFGFGSVGGWDPFGIEREITRSQGNRLYELDRKSALEIYKEYLGEEAKMLPGSALFFPLAIRKDADSDPIVRTILKVDESDQSMIFAGEMPQGWYAQLMKANFDRLIEGASEAAVLSQERLGEMQPDLALLVSCVGRRLVLDQRAEEEIEIVQEVIGKTTPIVGFYSYGEIAPTPLQVNSELHNQTMTITTISER